jgi:DNA-binding transcriptional LysR family regulator
LSEGTVVELRHLRSFLATAEEGSVTRAAARLYIAQPALSRQIRELERHVGGTLFTRHSRGIALTEAGSRLLLEARAIVARADRLLELTGKAADEENDGLTVGLLDEGAAELTAPILTAVRTAHPQSRIVARTVAWGPHAQELRTGALDALIGPRFSVPSDEFDLTPLYSDGRLAVLSSAHRLAEADQVPMEQLLDLAPLSASGLPQSVLDHFMLTELRGGQGPRQNLTQPFLMADGLTVIASGSAFMTVTKATERFYRHPGVVFRPLPGAPPTETVIATRRGTTHESALVRSLVALAPAVAVSLIGLLPGAEAPPPSRRTTPPQREPLT